MISVEYEIWFEMVLIIEIVKIPQRPLLELKPYTLSCVSII